MTVSTTSYLIQYAGTGSTTDFATGFEFIADADLVVILTDSSGVDTTQVLTTNYTVSGAGNDAGGTVTMLVAPAAGETLTIYRSTALTQATDYTEGDPFPAETHEQALDKLTLISQELNGKLDDRVLSFKETEDRSGGTKNSDVPSPVENKVLGWDANGNLTNLTLSSASTDTDVDALIGIGDKGKKLQANTTEDGYALVGEAVAVTGTDTLTASVGLDAYNSNQSFVIKAAATNTGAVTLNLDSLGAKSVTLSDASALPAGSLVASQLYTVWYDGTQFILMNPSVSAAVADAGTQTEGVMTPERVVDATVKRVSNNSLSAASTLDLATVFSSNTGYRYFRIIIEELDFNSGAHLGLYVSIDGSTFEASAGDYRQAGHVVDSGTTYTATVQDNASDRIFVWDGVLFGASNVNAVIDVVNPHSTSKVTPFSIRGHLSAVEGTTPDEIVWFNTAGVYETGADDITGFRIAPNSSQTMTGTVQVWASNKPFF